MKKVFEKYMVLKKIAIALGVILCVVIALFLTQFPWWVQPSNARDWNADQVVLPEVRRDGDVISIKNVRNFSYRSTTDYTPGYYDATYNLNDLDKVYFVVEPFTDFPGAAHTFVSFGFKDGRHLAISIEIRKEKGESFSALGGMMKNYELTYVIADERDVIKLRSNFRRDEVFVYPVRTTPEKVRALFISMTERATRIAQKPEFYHSTFNNCTTNIADHVNEISPNRIPWSWSQILPAAADKTIYDLGLIDTDLSFEEARKKFHINARALEFADDANFSAKIRE